MRVLRGAPSRWDAGEPVALAVGVFDGVHLGHRHVLDVVHDAAEADGITPAILTFHPHPLALVAPEHAPRMLTTIDQRLELFDDAGIGLVAVLAFDESVRNMTPEAFVGDIVVDRLSASVVIAGADFRFGKDRAGDVGMLEEMGRVLGYRTIVSPLVGEGDPVSSTRIREALDRGDVEGAAALLGREYELIGIVVPGSGRGAEFGVATANVDVDPSLSIPGRGVYAARAGVGELVPAVANIGVRPTFGEAIETVEVHVIDRYLEIAGHTIRVEFVARLRDERKFSGVAELAAQIEADIEAARAVL